MAIRFFFEYEKEVIQLPVNPEELTVESKGSNKSEEVVALGEVTILRDIKLKSISIECFFPLHSDAPYVLTYGKFKKPQFYIDFFEKVRNAKKPCRLIITDTKINTLVSIESFEWGLQAGDDDTHYVLKLKEYKNFSVKEVIITTPPTTTTAPKASVSAAQRPKTGFAIGDVVIANGKYWYTSYGDSPFGTFNNFTGKISHIVADKKRKYRYHITTMTGGYRGWVNESQIKHKQ